MSKVACRFQKQNANEINNNKRLININDYTVLIHTKKLIISEMYSDSDIANMLFSAKASKLFESRTISA